MPSLTIQQAKFVSNNRKKLLQRLDPATEFIIIAGHSYTQATYDRAYPFQQDSNFFYLTGINEAGIVLVIDKGEEYLIVPERNETRITFEGAVDLEKLSRTSGIETVYGAKEGWEKLVKRLKKAQQVGVLMSAPEYAESIDMFSNPSRKYLIDRLKKHKKRLKFTDLRPDLVRMRMIKSRYEIKMIKEAVKHTKRLFTDVERRRRKAEYEYDLLAEITKQAIKYQLEFAYDPIIAGGLNAVTLHYIANNSKIDAKAPLLLDIGLKYNGYSADITRTVSSSPTERQRKVYEAVLAVQEYAISLLKPGVLLKEYEEEVVQFMGGKLRELGLIKSISKESVRRYYPHSTSHFLGIDVHDAGDYEHPLEKGMVLTVEPGIYIKEEAIGVRIEDDILITKEGCQVLTNKLPRNLSSLTIKA